MLLKDKMLITDIENGNLMTIITRDGQEMQGVFLETKNFIQFYMGSAQVCEAADKVRASRLKLKFFHKGVSYEFTAQVIGFPEEGKNANLVELRAVTPIKESSMRNSLRIDHKTNIICKRNDRVVIEGVTNDISQGGVGVWSDHNLDAETGELFSLSFVLNTPFILNAKLVRKQGNNVTRAYEYEYGFVFASNDDEVLKKLIGEILTAKLK
ncbi:MAG: PilZ domain-containing protein [Defluviitaleaceae bacterium]|nr:PilZ domain-containing protein [Defluviitaleaceae bacterium]